MKIDQSIRLINFKNLKIFGNYIESTLQRLIWQLERITKQNARMCIFGLRKFLEIDGKQN